MCKGTLSNEYVDIIWIIYLYISSVTNTVLCLFAAFFMHNILKILGLLHNLTSKR